MITYKKLLTESLILAACLFLIAVESLHAQVQKQDQGSEVIYGSQLMTQQEQAAHRAKMRSLKTNEEREAFRLDHHKQMLERAKDRGVTLPEEPLNRGRMGAGPNNPPAGGGAR